MKPSMLNIMPECYVDTNLMNVLVQKCCNHQKGCATVCKTMSEKFTDRFAIGVIDRDKKAPDAIKEYDEVVVSEELNVLKHRVRPHYIILIGPAVEVFVLRAAEALDVKMEDYGLSSDLETLKKQTKTESADSDEKFRKLFWVLQDAPNIGRLKALLNYLITATFAARNEDIVKIVNE